MRIHFSKRANSKLELLSALGTEKTGFIFGFELGKNIIIQNVLPLNFEDSTVNQMYNIVYKKKGDSLLGVFFMHEIFFLNDCFLENIILTVQKGRKKVFRYGLDEDCTEKKCTLIHSQ